MPNATDDLEARLAALDTACSQLRALFERVHDLGGVGYPYFSFRIRSSFAARDPSPALEGRPEETVTFPRPSGSAHDQLRGATTIAAWNAANQAAKSAVVQAAKKVLAWTVEPYLDEPPETGEVALSLSISAGVHLCIGAGLHEALATQGIATELAFPRDMIATKALLTAARARVPMAPGTHLWKIEGHILDSFRNTGDSIAAGSTLSATGAVDALLRAALDCNNALLQPERVERVRAWRCSAEDEQAIHAAIGLAAKQKS